MELSKSKLNFYVGVFTLARLFVSTSSRMVYPFLAIFAAGMKVPIATISLALAVSMAASAVVPFLAPIADQRGRKNGMLIGLGIFLAGTLAASLFPHVVTFFITILLCNLGNNLLISAIQAYIGDNVAYQKRGLYLAIGELSWAMAFIVMAPLAGLVLERANWNAPYIWLTVLGAIMAAVIWRVVPQDQPAAPEPITVFKDIRAVLSAAPAVFAMLMGTAFIVGNEVVNVVFGVWMQDSFGLQIAALGAASMVIGFSELTGEGLAAVLADRLGKERLMGISFLANGLWVISLPWLGQSQFGAFVWLFMFYLTFEVGIVSSLPVMTEVVPQARATMMALFIAALSLGRALGDLLAPGLYAHGFLVNAFVCLGLDLVALVFLSRIRLPKTKPTEP